MLYVRLVCIVVEDGLWLVPEMDLRRIDMIYADDDDGVSIKLMDVIEVSELVLVEAKQIAFS